MVRVYESSRLDPNVGSLEVCEDQDDTLSFQCDDDHPVVSLSRDEIVKLRDALTSWLSETAVAPKGHGVIGPCACGELTVMRGQIRTATGDHSRERCGARPEVS